MHNGNRITSTTTTIKKNTTITPFIYSFLFYLHVFFFKATTKTVKEANISSQIDEDNTDNNNNKNNNNNNNSYNNNNNNNEIASSSAPNEKDYTGENESNDDDNIHMKKPPKAIKIKGGIELVLDKDSQRYHKVGDHLPFLVAYYEAITLDKFDVTVSKFYSAAMVPLHGKRLFVAYYWHII